ncbi:MAG: flagellar hook-basal body complex protein FliE [Thermodesulfobacteriota bacterium]
MNRIESSNTGLVSQPAGKSRSQGEGFAQRLKDAVQEVNQEQISADQAVHQVVEGRLGIHEGMLRVQEADLSFRFFLQVRAKVIDAYREIMRLQF